MLMGWFRSLFFAGLFACFASAQLMLAQSDADLPQPSTSVSTIPSNSADQSNSIAQPELTTGRKKSPKSAHAGGSSKRSMLASGVVPGESQYLCFQPGVGWRRAPQAVMNSTGHLTATSATGSSTGIQTGGSAAGPDSGTANAIPSGARQTKSDQCAGSVTGAAASRSAMNALMAGAQTQPEYSNVPTMNMNAGAQNNELQVNSGLNLEHGLASPGSEMGAHSGLDNSKRVSQHAGTSVSTDSGSNFGYHAYINPIQLRKEMWNAPDLETRLRLQKLIDGQKKKLRKDSDRKKQMDTRQDRPDQSMPVHADGGTASDSQTYP